MSEEEMEILKELSEQNYFGDLPFLLYADLIGRLIANYNKEKEKNKELDKFIKEGITIEPNNPYKNFQLNYLRENFIQKSKVEELIQTMNTNILNAEKFDYDYIGQCRFAKYVLQSLLGKE